MVTCYMLPWAAGDSEPVVLLGQRQLIQRWINGQLKSGIIPDWAGQWAVIGGLSTGQEPYDVAARRLFFEQTGINFADGDVAKRYDVQGQKLVSLQDQDLNRFYVLYVVLKSEGLTDLNTQVNANIINRAIRDGVLVEVLALRQAKAMEQLGPVAAPPDGWNKYLIRNYYGGQAPGPLNTEIGTLTTRIATRTRMPDAWFQLALENIPTNADNGETPQDDVLKVSSALLATAEPVSFDEMAEELELSGASFDDDDLSDLDL